MKRAHSSQRGIVFSDPAIEGVNAVYCWREDGQVELLTGKHEDLMELFKQEKKADKVKPEKDPHSRLMLRLLAAGIVLVAAIAVLTDGISPVVGATLFAVIGWFPTYALMSAGMHDFASDELFEQFRRNHGAEHAVFAHFRRKNPTWALDDLRNDSWLDPECGTVYMASLLLWTAIAGVAVAFFPQLGLFKLIGLLLGFAVLILLNNWFNTANPLKRAQMRMVAKPGDAELLMALAGMQAFLALVGESESKPTSHSSPQTEAGNAKKPARQTNHGHD